MAFNSQSRGIASFGKRFVNQIWNSNFHDPAPASLRSVTVTRAGVHVSAYDKNDEQVPPSVVPDDVIQPQSDKYWAPHPQTGVFGPAAEQHTGGAGGEGGFHTPPGNGGGDSVLERQAWFRPLEDVEKPNQP